MAIERTPIFHNPSPPPCHSWRCFATIGVHSGVGVYSRKVIPVNTELSTETRLEVLEREINDAAHEAWVYVGQRLFEIREKRMYEELGYKTWTAYCASGRLEYNKGNADKQIRSSQLRIAMGNNITHHLGYLHCLELGKCETTRDAVRVAKKAIAQAKKTNSRVTASLIAEIRDGDGETGKASAQAEKTLDAARLDKHLTKLADILLKWRMSLESVPIDAWDDVPRDVLIRVKTESANLTTFLRS